MRLRAHPFFTLVGIVLLLAISVTTFFVDGLQWSFRHFLFSWRDLALVSAQASKGFRRAADDRSADEVYSSLHLRGIQR